MNTEARIERRPDRVPVRIEGPDAEHLLNDVLTGHVEAAAGPARWWALLSPQGKIQAEGLIGFADDAFWLDVHADVVEHFIRRMRLYKLRAKLEIAALGETHAVGWSPVPTNTSICHEDGRLGDLGYRVVAETGSAADWSAGTGYDSARIAAGLSELGPDYALDSTFPHDVGMDLLGGIDFEKGCYVGQEVVSRMKHRGTARRRPVIVSGSKLKSGAAIRLGVRDAGTVGRVTDGAGVAILRLDRINDPAEASSGDAPVALALPEWASYRFGDSGGARAD